MPCYAAVDIDLVNRVVKEGERLGYDGVWVNDHLMFGRDNSQLECWTLLSSFVTLAKEMRLGTLVMCHAYRSPSMVAKMSAALDFISGGRLTLGLGAGWNRTEAKAYGVPWVSSHERIAQLREYVQLIVTMWTEEQPKYGGRYYQVENAVCNPKPVQRPHPPIMIGAAGRKMLRLVAQLADGWNWNRWDKETFEQKLEILRSYCSDVRRNFDSIEKSIETPILIRSKEHQLRRVVQQAIDLNPQKFDLSVEGFRKNSLTGNADECTKTIEEYVGLGVSRFMFYFLDLPSLDGMNLFADEVMPSFK